MSQFQCWVIALCVLLRAEAKEVSGTSGLIEMFKSLQEERVGHVREIARDEFMNFGAMLALKASEADGTLTTEHVTLDENALGEVFAALDKDHDELISEGEFMSFSDVLQTRQESQGGSAEPTTPPDAPAKLASSTGNRTRPELSAILAELAVLNHSALPYVAALLQRERALLDQELAEVSVLEERARAAAMEGKPCVGKGGHATCGERFFCHRGSMGCMPCPCFAATDSYNGKCARDCMQVSVKAGGPTAPCSAVSGGTGARQ